MVDLQLSLLICHSGWNGNVEGDEDFPWCEQPTSFCLSHYWACADTAVWIYNLRKAVHLWFVSPLQLENSMPAVVVAQIQMVGLLNSLYVQHVLYCMLCFSLINYALRSLQLSKELSLEWNFTLMIIHLFQRPILTKRLLRTADAHCRHQTSEKPCPLTSCALPSTYSMYPWCPLGNKMTKWSDDCESLLGQWTSQLRPLGLLTDSIYHSLPLVIQIWPSQPRSGQAPFILICSAVCGRWVNTMCS